MAEDEKRHVWGGLLTTEAAEEVRQWTADGKEYRVRAIPLLDFLCGDAEWRAQWRNPLQLLRMQLTNGGHVWHELRASGSVVSHGAMLHAK